MIAENETSSIETSFSQEASLSGRQVSLVEVLDRVLNKGAVLTGGITISVADIPLLYVGLNLLIASVETVERHVSSLSPLEGILTHKSGAGHGGRGIPPLIKGDKGGFDDAL